MSWVGHSTCAVSGDWREYVWSACRVSGRRATVPVLSSVELAGADWQALKRGERRGSVRRYQGTTLSRVAP